jgi:hypothetical protein
MRRILPPQGTRTMRLVLHRLRHRRNRLINQARPQAPPQARRMNNVNDEISLFFFAHSSKVFFKKEISPPQVDASNMRFGNSRCRNTIFPKINFASWSKRLVKLFTVDCSAVAEPA